MNILKHCLLAAGIIGASGAVLFANSEQPAPTFHVRDFGAIANDSGNDRDAINQAIAAAARHGAGAVVAFDPGIYRIGLNEAELQTHPFATTTVSGKRGLRLIDIRDVEGITLKGDATTLLITDPRPVAFDFSGSKDCSMSGFTIDLDPLPFLQGNITSVDTRSRTFEITIPEEYPLLGQYPWLTLGPQEDWSNRHFIFGTPDAATSDRHRRNERIMLYEFRPRVESARDQLSFEQTGPRQFRIRSKVDLDASIKPGNTFVYTSKVGGESLFKLGNYGNEAPTGSNNLHIEDVDVYASPGFVIAGYLANDLHLKRFSIRTKPDTDRLVAGTSDGIHVRGTRAGPYVEDGYFEAIQDDIVNLSSVPIPVVSVVSPTQYLIHPHRGHVEVGDTVYGFHHPSGEPRGEARVVSIEPQGGRTSPRLMSLDAPLASIGKDDFLFSRNAENPGAIFRNNVFKDGLRSGIMHMAGDGTLIEGNRFERMRNAIAIRQAGHSLERGQGGSVRNLTIRNNEFYACSQEATGHTNHPDAVIGVMMFPDSTSRTLDNVLIEGNTIVEPGLYAIWVSNVNNAKIINNKVIAHPDSAALGRGSRNRIALRVDNSSNVVIDNLDVIEPRSDLAAVVSTDSFSESVTIGTINAETTAGQTVLENNDLRSRQNQPRPAAVVPQPAAPAQASAARPQQGTQRPLKVFILAGQSNMVGSRSEVALLPESVTRAGAEQVLFFNGDTWLPMTPGVTEPRGGFGPEFTFAAAMTEALGEPIGIIKHSRGGSTLSEHWHPNRTHKDNNLYAQLLQKVKLAGEQRPIEIVGMLWMQGESDAVNHRRADPYLDNLKLLVEDARKQFSNDNMVFLCGRVNPPVDRYPEAEKIRNAQQTLQISNYQMLDFDDLPKVADNLHYNTEGIMEMGYRFANAIQQKQSL